MTFTLSRIRSWLLPIALPMLLQGREPQTPTIPPESGQSTLKGQVGDLMVAPTRLLFFGNRRSAELTLINRGPKAATYRITFVEMDMTEEGGTKLHERKEKEILGSDLVRYSPREVLLEPNVAQAIRLQLRKPADLPAGEYRSHLSIFGIPDPEEAKAPGEKTKPDKIIVDIRAVFGVSIPVIIRHGATSATATLEGLHVETPSAPSDSPILTFRIHRQGNQSVYGDLRATYLPRTGPAEEVGLMKGVGVYLSIPARRVRMELQRQNKQPLGQGRLQLALLEMGTDTPLAQASLELP